MDKVVKGPGGVDVHTTFEDINSTMVAFVNTASVEHVYGTPIEVGETIIIPTAENLVVMGFGAGGGYGTTEFEGDGGAQSTGEGVGEGSGGGGGGGGRTLSRPVAVIIASPDGVRVEPVTDSTKIFMAAITAVGFMAGMFFRMTRGPRSL